MCGVHDLNKHWLNSNPNFNLLSFFLQCYKRILQLDPVNVQGLHNLCVVYVERGKLAKAQECMLHVRQLAPTEDYILRHLQIVQTRIAKLMRSAGNSLEKEIAFEEFDPKDFGGSIQSRAMAIDVDGPGDHSDMAGLSSPIVSDDQQPTDGRRSVSKQEKPQGSMSSVDQHQKRTLDQPVFIGEEAATIQEEYRPSNSVQNNANRRHHYPPMRRSSAVHRPPLVAAGQSLVSGGDDPSSGMS